MTQKLNKESYVQLIKEDIEWLEKTEDCLERQHIKLVLLDSIRKLYNEERVK
jgi:hypothetical protein